MKPWSQQKCLKVLDEIYADNQRRFNAKYGPVVPTPPPPRVAKPKTAPTPLPPGSVEEQAIALVRRGLPAWKVAERLAFQVTTAQVTSLSRQHVTKATRQSLSTVNKIDKDLLPLIIELMETELGKDRYYCEVCEEDQQVPCIVHHTKYEGATLYDLVFACSSCNNSRMNRGLS